MTPEELAWAERQDDDAIEEFLWAKEEVEEVSGYLDKAGRDLQELFDLAGLRVDLREDGEIMGDGIFSWSKKQVATTAEALRSMPFERLEPHLDAADEYVKNYYGTLVAFFEDAAASEAAAIMTYG
ncbi:YfbM family protein [Glycomyces sp. L485]|nr:YfbM family protein [Glycomyces sp. L485]